MARQRLIKLGTLLGMLLFFLGLGLGVSTVALAKQSPPQADKVLICHNPSTEDEKTLEVARKGWENGHSKHGDILGECPTPLGGKIVFTSRDVGGISTSMELFVMESDGTGLTNLTNNGWVDEGPSWSSDGSRIAFSSDPTSRQLNSVYVMNADGTNVVLLADPGDSPSFSPDGSKIAFTSNRDNSQGEVYVMNSDGSNVTRLTFNSTIEDGKPSWSPDGAKIAFPSDRDNGIFREIYAMDADGSNQIRLTSSASTDHTPDWSPDGTEIAFASNRDGNWEIYVMDADGSNQTNITNNAADDVGGHAWSPDGTKIAFSTNRDGNQEIYVMDADGSNPTRLTDSVETNDFVPDWGP